MIYSRKQIEQRRRADLEFDRRFSPQQRLDTTMALFYMGCETMRAGVRLQFPEATPDEIEERVRERIQRSKQWRSR